LICVSPSLRRRSPANTSTANQQAVLPLLLLGDHSVLSCKWEGKSDEFFESHQTELMVLSAWQYFLSDLTILS